MFFIDFFIFLKLFINSIFSITVKMIHHIFLIQLMKINFKNLIEHVHVQFQMTLKLFLHYFIIFSIYCSLEKNQHYVLYH